jgi:hypothetical protein
MTSLVLLLALVACGGGGRGSASSSGASSEVLSGNWQLNLLQEEPREIPPQNQLSVSGFLVESNSGLTGSVQVPPVAARLNCGGVSILAGTVDGQSVIFTLNEGGTTLNFTGTISSDNQSMSGDYQGPGGGCFTRPTSGTWNAFLVPSLSGSFTGTLSNSAYMQALLGESAVPPIAVSGKMTQGANTGGSTATLTGTINAAGYPCFSTATLTGTISGQNVILSVFGYDGVEIGSIGTPGTAATVVVGPDGVSLIGVNTGQELGLNTGTCPRVAGVSSDSAQVSLTFP